MAQLPASALKPTSGLIKKIAAHAAQAYPRECCGLVVRLPSGRLRYQRCNNLARGEGGQDRFELDPADYAAAEDAGEVIAVVHSHPNASANPSQADRVMCERSGLPWVIMGWPSGVVKTVEPSGFVLPLVGRQFHHGVVDCYTLIRDYYAQELAIELPDYQRDDAWWERGGDLYRDNFASAGFDQVAGAPRVHDVILMQVAADVPNHAGVLLEGGVLLHHLYGRLSGRDVYGGYWARHTHAILRHRSLQA